MTDTSYDGFGDAGAEVITSDGVEVIPGNAILPSRSAFDAMLEKTASDALADPEAVQRSITERILNAGSVEEILTQPEVRHAREFLDEPLVLYGVHFNQSDFDEGPGFYAVVQASEPDTGDIFAVTCGGRNVMAQLYALAARDAFPVTVKFTQARKPTRQGYYPLWLVAG